MVLARDKSKAVKVAVPTPGGDEVFLVLRWPDDETLDTFRRTEVRDRMEGQIDFKDQVAFVDSLLEGCENIEYRNDDGAVLPLTADVPDWKAKIERDWKLSVIPLFLYPSGRVVGNGDAANF